MPQTLTVMVLPSKDLLTIELPREKGDLVTVEEFISLLEAKLPSNVRLERIMVGDRRIYPLSNAFRFLHFFLLDNCPWYVHTKPVPESLSMQLSVKLHDSKVIPIKAYHDSTGHLYKVLEGLTGVPMNEFRLLIRDRKQQQDRYYFRLHDKNFRLYT